MNFKERTRDFKSKENICLKKVRLSGNNLRIKRDKDPFEMGMPWLKTGGLNEGTGALWWYANAGLAVQNNVEGKVTGWSRITCLFKIALKPKVWIRNFYLFV